MTGTIQALETAAGVASNGWNPYPGYKDSDVKWLGRVPETWGLRRTKTLLRERVQKGFPDEPMLAATQTKGVVRKEQYENRTVLALKDLHLLKLVRRGDFVISLRSFQGGIEYAHEQGIISPAYTVLYPLHASHHGYLAKLFKSKPYIENLTLHVTGIRQGQNIDYTQLARAPIPLPPPSEQDAIVRFLNYHDRLIRKYIRAKQKLIALLTEQKQAIIQHAVTRGLNPDVKLKPSGVNWLGDIPVGWKVRRLRTFIDRVTSGSRGWSNYAADAGPLFLRITNLSRMSLEIDLHDQLRLDLSPEALREGKRTRVQSGDLLLSITAYIGSVAIVPDDFEEAYVSQHVACCRLRPGVANPRWLGYVLLSPIGQTHGSLCMYGGTKQGLSLDDVKNYVLLLPPRHEQDELVKAIESEAESVDTAITRTERQIALMREYRIRLTADVVTGKIDVREAATGLPDLPPDEMRMNAGLTEEDAEEMEA